MTRQRQTHLLIIGLVPAVIFGAVRCADAVSAPTPQAEVTGQRDKMLAAKLAKLHQENDWVGRLHNDALAFVLAKLQRIPVGNRSRRNVCETARKAYNDFHRNLRGAASPASVDAEFATFCASDKSPRNLLTRSLGVPHGRKETELSPTAVGFMEQISSAIDASNSHADLNSRVSAIEAEAAATLSYEEAGAVVAVGAVATSSADYWVANITSWLPYTSTPDYAVLVASRFPSESVRDAPSGFRPRAGWGEELEKIWTDARAAAKRAAKSDLYGAIKIAVAAGAAGGPVIYDLLLAGAATASIMGILHM